MATTEEEGIELLLDEKALKGKLQKMLFSYPDKRETSKAKPTNGIATSVEGFFDFRLARPICPSPLKYLGMPTRYVGNTINNCD